MRARSIFEHCLARWWSAQRAVRGTPKNAAHFWGPRPRGPSWPKSRTRVRTGAATVHVVQAVLRPRPLRTLQPSFRGRERSERSPESINHRGRVGETGPDITAWGYGFRVRRQVGMAALPAPRNDGPNFAATQSGCRAFCCSREFARSPTPCSRDRGRCARTRRRSRGPWHR